MKNPVPLLHEPIHPNWAMTLSQLQRTLDKEKILKELSHSKDPYLTVSSINRASQLPHYRADHTTSVFGSVIDAIGWPIIYVVTFLIILSFIVMPFFFYSY